MLKKGIGRTVVSQTLLIAVNLLFSLFYLPYLLRSVGSEAYGFYPLSLNIINFGTLITVIFTSFLSGHASVRYLERDFRELNEVFNSSLFVNAVIGLIILIPLLFASFNIERLLTVPGYLKLSVKILFIFASLSFFVIQIRSTFVIANISTERRYLTTLQKAAEKLMTAAAAILFFELLRPSVGFVGAAVFLAALGRFFLTVMGQRKIMPQIRLSAKYIKKTVVISLITAGSWHSLSQMSVIFFGSTDIILANILFGPLIQTEYSLGMIIPNLIKSSVVYLANWILPFFAVLEEQEKGRLVGNLLPPVKILSAAAAAVASVIIGFGDVFLKLWIVGYYSLNIYIILILGALSVYVYASFAILNAALLIRGYAKIPALAAFSAGILNIPLSILLSRLSGTGIFGIAAASLILNILVYMMFMPRYVNLKLKVKKAELFRAFAPSSLLLAAGAAISLAIKGIVEPGRASELVPSVLLVLLILAFAALFLIFSPEDKKFITDIIKAKKDYGNDLYEQRSGNDDSLL